MKFIVNMMPTSSYDCLLYRALGDNCCCGKECDSEAGAGSECERLKEQCSAVESELAVLKSCECCIQCRNENSLKM